MSDYSDYYDDSEWYGDISDNYAGAYGGYDDLYDDVMGEAGYDAWDIENPEFNYDEEGPVFKFDPFTEGDNVVTYQALGELSDMTTRLLQAWEKISTSGDSESERPDLSEVSDYPYYDFFV